MDPTLLKGGPTHRPSRPSYSNRRTEEERQQIREARMERERQSVQAAIERHREWMAARSSSTIIDSWDREARRQAEEAAASEVKLLREVRQLREAERRPPLRPPLGPCPTDIPPDIPTATTTTPLPQSDEQT